VAPNDEDVVKGATMIVEKELNFSQLVLDSAKENFETMIFMSIEEVADPGEPIDGPLLMGTLTFCQALEGSFSMTCSEECARAMALSMLGMDPSEELSDEELHDAMGEVTNLIMESVKKNMQGHINDLSVSMPLVVCGEMPGNNLGEGAEKVSVFLSIQDEYLAELTLSYRHNVNHQIT